MDSDPQNSTKHGVIKVSTSFLNIKLRVQPHAWHPATDLFETPQAYIIKVEIAGMAEEELKISMEENSVMIYGNRPLVNPDGAFHRLEIPYGEFSSSVEIPHDIDLEHVSANYHNGFLIIELPKALPVNIKVEQS